MKKTKILFSAVMAAVFCLSMIAGSTFAIFTSEKSVNIAVTSGKVDVKASLSLESLTRWSQVDYTTGEKVDGATDTATTVTNNSAYFDGSNSSNGFASVSGTTLTVTKMLPGDVVVAKVTATNNSNVSVNYRLTTSADLSGLAGVLEMKTAEDTLPTDWSSVTAKNVLSAGTGAYQSWTTTGDKSIYVQFALPGDVGNAFQDDSATISFTFEAVQGNAVTGDTLTSDNKLTSYIGSDGNEYSLWDGIYETTNIPTAATIDQYKNYSEKGDSTEGYYWPEGFVVDYSAKTVKIQNAAAFAYLNIFTDHCVEYSGGYDGSYMWTVTLECNIDLAGNSWTPIKNSINIDGNGKVIKNLYINQSADNVGLVGFTTCSVSDLTIENAIVKGKNHVGVLAGVAQQNVSDIIVKNFLVQGNKYVGGLIGQTGQITVSNCNVSNGKLAALDLTSEDAKEFGGIAGSTDQVNSTSFTKLTVSNLSIIANSEVGGILGRCFVNKDGRSVTFTECKVESVNVKITGSNEKLVGQIIGRIYGTGGTLTIDGTPVTESEVGYPSN